MKLTQFLLAATRRRTLFEATAGTTPRPEDSTDANPPAEERKAPLTRDEQLSRAIIHGPSQDPRDQLKAFKKDVCCAQREHPAFAQLSQRVHRALTMQKGAFQTDDELKECALTAQQAGCRELKAYMMASTSDISRQAITRHVAQKLIKAHCPSEPVRPK
jgi:hypothetical protein